MKSWMRFWRRRPDDDFDGEIRAHIEFETERLIADGMPPDKARAQARRAFGNVTAHRERFHDAQRNAFVEELVRDVRYATRAMRRSPGFVFIAGLCLAVGISVNTAAFSVLNAILFRNYPGVVRQNELATVTLGFETEWGRSGPGYASFPEWEILRSTMPAFSGIAADGSARFAARTSGEPQAVRGTFVSGSFFAVVGTVPAKGRFIVQSDDAPGADPVVVISHPYWERVFDSRPDVVGQALTIGTVAFTVIGVAPRGFFGVVAGELVDPDFGASELFVPLASAGVVRAQSAHAAANAALDDRWLRVFGRLGPQATLAEVRSQSTLAAAQIARTFPNERRNAYAEVRAGPPGTSRPGESIAGVMFVMIVPVLILLVACANLANQLLARAVHRAREIAVRLSLGATRARIVRQLLVETAMLALAAGVAGIGLARVILDVVRAAYLPLPFRIPIDLNVLAFTVGLALLSAAVFGLTPALRATRADLLSALKDGAPGSGLRRSRLRSALVVVQVTTSLALIATSGVFVGAAKIRQPAAVEAAQQNAFVIAVDLDLLGFDSTSGRAHQALMMERLSQLPGVASVGMAPFEMFKMLGGSPVAEVGGDSTSEQEYEDVGEVTGHWFDATGNTAIRGRLFAPEERNANVAVVDEAFANSWWDGRDAIGRTLRIGSDSAGRFVTVVGVVPTRGEVAVRQPEGVIFVPGTAYRPRTYYYVRARGDAAPLMANALEAVRSLDSRVPILWVRSMADVAAHEGAPLAMVASGLVALGSVGLALAALGLFGVLSFVVAQRHREIGIRVALGAGKLNVMWMVLRHSLMLTVAGIAAGTGLAAGAVTVLRTIMHGLTPIDPVALGLAAGVMILVAVLASLVPARRALRVEPILALRSE